MNIQIYAADMHEYVGMYICVSKHNYKYTYTILPYTMTIIGTYNDSTINIW